MIRSLLGLALALAVCSPAAGEETWPGWRGKARHVVIAVIDGPRWSETWGDPTFANIPHLARELAPLGTRYTRFRNTGWTYTTCGHTALTTGFYEQIENSGKQLPAHPSLFQYYRAATLRSAESTWVIASKGKLSSLAIPPILNGKGGSSPASTAACRPRWAVPVVIARMSPPWPSSSRCSCAIART